MYKQNDYDWWQGTALCSAEAVVSILKQYIIYDSVIDIGCAQGAWLSVFHKYGAKTIKGIDGDWIDIDKLLIPKKDFISSDLKTLNVSEHLKYDLAVCLEVAEHLNENSSDNLIDNLTKASDVILFSAAIPGQGGQNHVNEKEPSYWKQKFNKRGFKQYDCLRPIIWENEKIAWWYKQNIMIYSKKEISNISKLSYFGGQHIVHPEALHSKINELNPRNISFLNLIKLQFQKIYTKFKT